MKPKKNRVMKKREKCKNKGYQTSPDNHDPNTQKQDC